MRKKDLFYLDFASGEDVLRKTRCVCVRETRFVSENETVMR